MKHTLKEQLTRIKVLMGKKINELDLIEEQNARQEVSGFDKSVGKCKVKCKSDIKIYANPKDGILTTEYTCKKDREIGTYFGGGDNKWAFVYTNNETKYWIYPNEIVCIKSEQNQDSTPTDGGDTINYKDGSKFESIQTIDDTTRQGVFKSIQGNDFNLTQKKQCNGNKDWGFEINGMVYCQTDQIVKELNLWDNYPCVKLWGSTPEENLMVFSSGNSLPMIVFQFEQNGKFYTYYSNGKVQLSSEGGKFSTDKLEKSGRYTC